MILDRLARRIVPFDCYVGSECSHRWILGEDERGEIVVPDPFREGHWREQLSTFKLRHWIYVFNSWWYKAIAMVEPE